MSYDDERNGFDDEEEEEFGPGDPDYDLSEQHGYMWEPERESWPVPRGVLLIISVLVIAALVLPALLIFLQRN